MAEEQLSVSFDGAAVATGRMNVRDFAPSLLALADLLQDAHRLLRPDHPDVAVQVTTPQEGSFEVSLVVVTSLMDQLRSALTSEEATAGANLLAYTAAVIGALKLVVGLYRRRIRRTEELPAGTVRLELDNGTTIEAPAGSLAIYQDVTTRRSLRRFVEPLGEQGIDEMIVSHREQKLTIGKAEREAFDLPPADDDLVLERSNELVVHIASVAFVEGNKWRLNDGESTFYAVVADEGFLERVDRNEERFGKGDLLRVRLSTKQWRSEGGLRAEHTVERVIEHIAAARQLRLPFVDADAEPDGNDTS